MTSSSMQTMNVLVLIFTFVGFSKSSSCSCPCSGITNRIIGADGRWYGTADDIRPNATYTWVNYRLGSGGDADGRCGDAKTRKSYSSKATGETCHGDGCGPLSTLNWNAAPRYHTEEEEADESVTMSPAIVSMISDNVWSTQTIVLDDGSAWKTAWDERYAGALLAPGGWIGRTSEGVYARYCNARVLVMCEDPDSCCGADASSDQTESPTAAPVVQCTAADNGELCLSAAADLCTTNAGYRNRICPYMCGTCNVPYVSPPTAAPTAAPTDAPTAAPEITLSQKCKPWCKPAQKTGQYTLAKICTFANCQGCKYKGGLTCAAQEPVDTVAIVPTVPPTPAPTAAPANQGACKPWCTAFVGSGKMTVAEVCAYKVCEDCNSFPGPTKKCTAIVASNPPPSNPAPPSPSSTPSASAAACKSFCYANVKSGKETIAEVCAYKGCKDCDAFPGATKTCAAAVASNPAPPSPSSTPSASAAVCKPFCYANVNSGKETIAEVCAYKNCKDCASFAGSTETCAALASKPAPPSPSSAPEAMCKSWCYTYVEDGKQTIAEVCAYKSCKDCASFAGSTETCAALASNSAPAAECKPWCYTNVKAGRETIAEVCAYSPCKDCDSFPGSTETCAQFSTAPSNPAPASTPPPTPQPTPPPPSKATVCKPWCTNDFKSGKQTKDALCSYSNCKGCDYSGSTCSRRRRARWTQPCNRMSAIECEKSVADGQCTFHENKQCIAVDHEHSHPIYDDEGLIHYVQK